MFPKNFLTIWLERMVFMEIRIEFKALFTEFFVAFDKENLVVLFNRFQKKLKFN